MSCLWFAAMERVSECVFACAAQVYRQLLLPDHALEDLLEARTLGAPVEPALRFGLCITIMYCIL